MRTKAYTVGYGSLLSSYSKITHARDCLTLRHMKVQKQGIYVPLQLVR